MVVVNSIVSTGCSDPASVDPVLRRVLSGSDGVRARGWPDYVEIASTPSPHWFDDLGAWICTTYDTATAVLNDPGRYSPSPGWTDEDVPANIGHLRRSWLEFSSGAGHRRMRAETMAAVHDLGWTTVAAHVDELVAQLTSGDGPVDLVSELDPMLGRIVLRDWLGFADEYLAEVDELLSVVGAALSPRCEPPALAAASDALATVTAMVGRPSSEATILAALADVGADGADTVVAARMVNLALDASPVSEAVSLCLHDMLRDAVATRYFTGNADDAGLVRDGVRELFRRDPTQLVAVRYAEEDHLLGGRRIAKDDQVIVLLGAANNDPCSYADPGAFAPGRGTPDLTFGSGTHSCLGRRFTVDLVGYAVAVILRRFPQVGLAGAPRFVDDGLMRELVSLPVALTGGERET